MSKIAVNEITDEQGSGRPSFTNGVQTSNINGGQVGGRRNLIINGAMQVAQRGTSATVSEGSNEGYSTLDRWRLNFGSGCPGEIEYSVSNDAPDGFSNSIKLSCTSVAASLSGNENIVLRQDIEGQNVQSLASGTGNEKTLTLSFWAKANNFNDVISVTFRSYDSGGNFHHLVREFSGITNTWARYEFTITANDLSDIVNDNTEGFRVSFFVAANEGSVLATNTFNTWQSGNYWSVNNGNFVSSTANEFYLTGVQLEVGDTATEFEHRSYGEELALCQRYYQKYVFNGSFPFSGRTLSANRIQLNYSFRVRMRATPTLDSSQITAPLRAYFGTSLVNIDGTETLSLSGHETVDIGGIIIDGGGTYTQDQIATAQINGAIAHDAEL